MKGGFKAHSGFSICSDCFRARYVAISPGRCGFWEVWPATYGFCLDFARALSGFCLDSGWFYAGLRFFWILSGGFREFSGFSSIRRGIRLIWIGNRTGRNRNGSPCDVETGRAPRRYAPALLYVDHSVAKPKLYKIWVEIMGN